MILHVRMIAARSVRGLIHPSTIEEIEGPLTKVIENFHRAVNVEALLGEHLFLAIVHS